MTITPMPGYLVAKPIQLEEKQTKSGLIVPVGAKQRGRLEETQQGEIISLCFSADNARDDMDIAYDIKAGDIIIYGEFAGFESDIEGQRYRFLKIEDVRAKLTE